VSISSILALVFGLLATVLGILLKAEFDKRMSLQQQVAENKRKAYAKFSELTNALMVAILSKNSDKEITQVAKRFSELRQEIWQYGSDDVVRAYAV
jgi:hypothetical protein